MKPKPKLALEALEPRDVPTLFGNPWQQAQSLTLSFAPDGVAYTNQTWGRASAPLSDLFAELSGVGAPAVWQEEVLRAVDAWTSQANVNVGLVADTGAAFGPAGLSPDVRPATFRVGAVSLGADVVAFSTPNHPLAGGYAGALVLNGAHTFTLGGANGTHDLYTVALHEFGNLLGLADSDSDPTSALNGRYAGPRAGLNAADVSRVRAMYGARVPDAHEGTSGNNTQATAAVLAGVSDPAAAGRTRVVANGDITTAGDADFYRFTLPAGTTSMTVRLGTAGKSLLAGRVDVYDSAGRLVGSRAGTGPLQGDPVLTLAGLQARGTYFVRVTGARADAFRTGAYQLRVGFGYDPVTETKTDPVQRFGADGGANDTRATASALTPTAGFATNSHYEWAGGIASLSDADYYRFTAPSTGGPLTLTVLSSAGLSTSAAVYTVAGQVAAANVLVNWEGGLYVAQVPNTVPGATYTVLLKVQDANWSAWSGNYAATIDFSQPLAQTQSLASGVANQSSRIAFGIDVQETGGFRLNLTATSADTAAVNWLDLYLYDATGNLVASVGTDGVTSTDTLFALLKKGQYTVVVQPSYTTGSAAAISYNVGMSRLTDPIDTLVPADPTNPPPVSPPPPPPPSGGQLGVIIISTPPWLPWSP